MTMYSLDGRIIPTINGFKEFDNGGKGSGNWGHAGRPGEIGGSASDGNEGSETYYGSKSDAELKSIEKDVLSRIQKLEKAKEHVADHHRYGSKEYDAEKEDIQYELDSLNDQHEEVKAEIKKREQSSKTGEEWSVTLKQIDDEYEKRGKEMEDNAGEIEAAIYETGETWTGPKQKALDLVKIGIRTNRNTFTDRDEFLEQTQGLFDDLKDVEGFKAKTVDVYEHPMSASGIVIKEHQKK